MNYFIPEMLRFWRLFYEKIVTIWALAKNTSRFPG
jgi:hypothetical protein